MKLGHRTIRLLEKSYGTLLLIYPKPFRERFSREMKLVFVAAARDAYERGGATALSMFLVRVVVDGLASSGREYFEMPQRLLALSTVLVLVFVNWLTFHDVFEPHTVRDYLTLAASILVFVHIGMDLRQRRIAAH
ncbi:hypothetical protein [Rhodanobacter sp. PCA2]|uniref:hypothetical protein n=1 Tax=Rhodanobacter sp. PCA2 TaxID=2006117 RepID=UPI0015E7C9FD|nr:hypothetical protein [Rhodanobacter sp. PCA2]MBA2079941.1 hypothetical protein [Rhodanobacter sp. PCA2]